MDILKLGCGYTRLGCGYTQKDVDILCNQLVLRDVDILHKRCGYTINIRKKG